MVDELARSDDDDRSTSAWIVDKTSSFLVFRLTAIESATKEQTLTSDIIHISSECDLVS
jgi:hypothetical protein